MRTVRYLLIALTASLALAGCGGKSEAADKPAASAPASASPEDAFIAQLEEGIPTYVVEPKRDELIKTGYDVCQTIHNGRLSESDIVGAVARTEGLEVGQAEALAWAAHDNFCPELDF
jgi:hypothetical protein